MIEAVGLAVVLSVLPLAVVAALLVLVASLFGEETAERPSVAVTAIEMSMLLVAGGYVLTLAPNDWTVGLSAPSAVDLGLGLLFFPLVLLTMQLQSLVGRHLGVENGDTAMDADYSKPAMVLIALVLVGPAEELLYRGIVQELLVGALGTVGGILVMALLFGLVHYPSYGADSVRDVDAGVVLGMAGTSVGGAAFGTLFVLTDTLIVPIVVHSVYDALLFADLIPGVDLSGDAASNRDAA